MAYLDGNSSATLRAAAKAAIEELISSSARNPSSIHRGGQLASKFLRNARRQVLSALGLDGDIEMFFTSGGTESCNTILSGWLPENAKAKTILSSPIEHVACLDALSRLESEGWKVEFLDVDSTGQVILPSEASMTEEALSELALVSLMAANNETGIIQPVIPLAKLFREAGYQGMIVSDFTQMPGKSVVRASELFDAGVDAIALSGHKVGAPPGVGAVAFKSCASGRCLDFNPMLLGGPQESYRRAGSENLIGIVAMGAAFEEMATNRGDEQKRMLELRLKLEEQISKLPGWSVFGETLDESERLANTALVQTSNLRGDDLVVALDLAGISLSTGSACSSGKQSASHVLQAMGLDKVEARNVIRLSLDWSSSESDIDRVIEVLPQILSEGASSQLPNESIAH